MGLVALTTTRTLRRVLVVRETPRRSVGIAQRSPTESEHLRSNIRVLKQRPFEIDEFLSKIISFTMDGEKFRTLHSLEDFCLLL